MIIGLVANPKIKRPLLASVYDQNAEIHRFEGKRSVYEGGGSFEEGTEGQYGRAAAVTGYPRVHTVDGVKTKGKGYGTALYTALCLAANQDDDGDIRLGLDVSGAGISSQEGTRSSSAEAWWSRAKDLDLAEATEDEITEENVDLDAGTDKLTKCLRYELEGKTISYVNTVNVDVTEHIEADYYTYDNATGAGLVLASFNVDAFAADDGVRLTYQALKEETADVHEVYADPLVALDVRGLPPHMIEIIALLLEWEGQGKAAAGVRLRYLLNLDPATGAKAAARILKPNAADAREISQVMSSVVKARKSVDWARLSKLP
jgi:hypothetical protein